MSKYCDLHVHTTFSDGGFSPEEVVRRARELSFAAVSICDHDTVDGVDPALEAGRRHGIEVIPAVELSAEEANAEVHILGYFIDYQDKEFRNELSVFCQRRLERMQIMVKKLQEEGLDIDMEEVMQLSGCGSVGRLTLAQLLYQKGYVTSTAAAFRRYIGDRSPFYVKKAKMTSKEAIRMILRIGGVPVLAHPFTMYNDKLIPQMIKDGIRGIETYHSDHTKTASLQYKKIAEDAGLIVTGGSDCHGSRKEKILLGTVRVPYEVVERLRDEAEKIKKI